MAYNNDIILYIGEKEGFFQVLSYTIYGSIIIRFILLYKET